MGREREPGDGERRSWHGMGQAKPRLPYYLRASERLNRLDAFERPAWKGRMRWAEDDRVTVRGVARETLQFLVAFFIIGIVAVGAWRWLYGDASCVELVRGFKMGWC